MADSYTDSGDHSKSKSDQSKDDKHGGHSYEDKDGFKKRCFCQKCEKKWKEWCEKHKKEGETHCKRKCYTVCEYKCKKPVTTVFNWGYHKKFVGEWEKHKAEDVPKRCKHCKKHENNCDCKKDHKKY